VREETLEGGRRHRGVTASDYPDSTSPHGLCRAWMHVAADRSDHLPSCSWRSYCRATQHRPSCSVSVHYLGTWQTGADCASLIETNEPHACGRRAAHAGLGAHARPAMSKSCAEAIRRYGGHAPIRSNGFGPYTCERQVTWLCGGRGMSLWLAENNRAASAIVRFLVD
jgi:hypothetical protein